MVKLINKTPQVLGKIVVANHCLKVRS